MCFVIRDEEVSEVICRGFVRESYVLLFRFRGGFVRFSVRFYVEFVTVR